MTPLLTLIYLFTFWLIYQLADALHDSWVHKEKSYFAVSKRTDISAETLGTSIFNIIKNF